MPNIRKTYIANYAPMVVAPGLFQIPSATINNNLKRCVLLSLIWSLLIINTTSAAPIRWQNLNNLITRLTIGNLAPVNPLGFNFRANLPPAPNGTGVLIFIDPGQYYFNNVFFQNELYFDQEFTNMDAVNTYSVTPNLIVEIEELK